MYATSNIICIRLTTYVLVNMPQYNASIYDFVGASTKSCEDYNYDIASLIIVLYTVKNTHV